MSNRNPQDAMVGDLIMWTSNYRGFAFGKIISFNRKGVPMVRPICPGSELLPRRYGRGRQAGCSWMVIAYGPNNPKSRSTAEPHPIALAKQQFAELESKIHGAF